MDNAAQTCTRALIGRQAELGEIIRLLTDPACRMLTIFGLGGSGKSLLADAAAAELARAGTTVLPVRCDAEGERRPLQERLAAAALLGPGDDLLAALAAWPGGQLLLVLDGLAARPGEAELLGALLGATPRLRLLVTARSALRLHDEWRYPLGGLALPADGSAEAVRQSGAGQLFIARVRQVCPGFDIRAEAAAVARICRLCEGAPLAIEQAARWAHTLSCAQIASELARGLGLLSGEEPDRPRRQRSLALIFAQALRQLGDEARALIARLAVFHEGFTLDAAAQVAQAAPSGLSELIASALVIRGNAGRYHLPRLLRRYLLGRPAYAIAERERLKLAHRSYYLDLLRAHRAGLAEGCPEVLADLSAERANIHAACQSAIAGEDLPGLCRSAPALRLFYERCGPHHAGLVQLEAAIELLHNAPPSPLRDGALAELLAGAGELGAGSTHEGCRRQGTSSPEALLAANRTSV